MMHALCCVVCVYRSAKQAGARLEESGVKFHRKAPRRQTKGMLMRGADAKFHSAIWERGEGHLRASVEMHE